MHARLTKAGQARWTTVETYCCSKLYCTFAFGPTVSSRPVQYRTCKAFPKDRKALHIRNSIWGLSFGIQKNLKCSSADVWITRLHRNRSVLANTCENSVAFALNGILQERNVLTERCKMIGQNAST